MRKKLLSLISILMTISIISTTFAFQASTEESESVIIINKNEKCELKDNVLIWTTSVKEGDFTLTFKDGVCSVDGNIIYKSFFLNDSEDSYNSNDSDENIYDLVKNYASKNPINELIFSDNVTEIHLFFELLKLCNNTTKVIFGKNVNIIGDYAFLGVPIKELILPENLKEIGGYAFSRTSIKELTIPESVKKIRYDAFINCLDLHDVTVLSKDVPLEMSGIGYDKKNFIVNYVEKNSFGMPFDDMTIRGYLNSTAEMYAQENGFKFIGLDGTRGDSNEDSKLNIVDAAFIAKRVAQRKTDLLPLCADYNMDGFCDIRDAAAIARDVARRKI